MKWYHRMIEAQGQDEPLQEGGESTPVVKKISPRNDNIWVNRTSPTGKIRPKKSRPRRPAR